MIFSLFKKSHDPVYPLTWVTPRLAVGHAPMSYAELDSIKKQGIKAIMNLCLEISELVRFEQEQGFEVYYLPIMDEGMPDMEELENALDWLDECIYLGKKVLIHCRHGIGRTGTVVYSYLLRKGLDKKSAGKKMRGLRSQPTEHSQKRFLHQYGKKEAPLSISEPSLIPEFKVELQPYFEKTKAILDSAGADIAEATPRCGRDHSRCCFKPLRLTLAEAVYLQFAVNTEFSSSLRQECIDRALAGAAACPLLKNESCLLYDFRPAQCRAFDRLRPEIPAEAAKDLQGVSLDLLEVFLGEKTGQPAPEFNVYDVVSGKWVQSFFHLLLSSV
ncbi:MAG: dual specificity protein phosphatase family protein [Desulfosalsimonadaceae bacterium]